MISKESLEKFKELYKKEFGEELSDQVALDKATRLLNLYRAVYLPVAEPGVSKKRKDRYR
jgi:hypothetical protein